MKLIFWLSTLTEHQIHLLRSLHKSPSIIVQIIVATDELSERMSQGWVKPEWDDLNVTVVGYFNWIIIGRQIVRDNPDAIHMFGGLWASRRFFFVLLYVAYKRKIMGLIVESYSDVKDGYLVDKADFFGLVYVALRPIAYGIAGKILNNHIKFIFAISNKAIEQFNRIGFCFNQIYPFGYFIKIPFDSDKKVDIQLRSELRLIFIGSLISRKGVQFVIDMALLCQKRKIPINIDVYGPGDPSNLCNISPNLKYCGLIPFGESPQVMKKYDLLLVPSKFDGWGVVVNEALEVGLPVLISKKAGSSILIAESRAGIVFDPDRINNLIVEIESIVKDKSIISLWRERALEYAKNLTPEIAAKYMLDCIKSSLLGAEKPKCPWYSGQTDQESSKWNGRKVVFYHRKPQNNNFSLEVAFQTLREAMPLEVNCVVAESRYKSQGIAKRIYNIIEASFRQGDVNHITGDVHFLCYLLKREKTLLTILDFVFMHNTHGIRRKIILLLWGLIPLKRVRLITVISNSTKNEALKYLKCSPDKIRVVPISISKNFIRVDKCFNQNKPQILHIGTTNNKNLIRLISALKNIPCKLEVIGRLSVDQLDALRVSNIEYSNSFSLTEEQMIMKYCQSDIVAFVSTYEGFGMPILEANAVGRAVITSNLYSMPEVAGSAACLVNPFDVLDIANGLQKIINNKVYRDQLISNGFDNIKRFEASIVAKQYAKIYNEMI